MAAPPPSQWHTGHCDCFSDCGICMFGWLLPCVLYGENAHKINGGGSCGPCMLYLFCDCLACLFAGNMRTELRTKYNLPEEPCSDCCAHFCMSSCAICQEARELKHRMAGGGNP